MSNNDVPSWLRSAVDTSIEEHLRERAVYMDWLSFGFFMHYDFASPHSNYDHEPITRAMT